MPYMVCHLPSIYPRYVRIYIYMYTIYIYIYTIYLYIYTIYIYIYNIYIYYIYIQYIYIHHTWILWVMDEESDFFNLLASWSSSSPLARPGYARHAGAAPVAEGGGAQVGGPHRHHAVAWELSLLMVKIIW